MLQPPSGEQFGIAHGALRATLVEVGGGIRELYDGERAVLEPYAAADMCDGGHGAVLVPWPNRVGDGRYSFAGADLQLPLTEPARRNAIHGLLRWSSWRALEHQPDQVLMGARVNPQPGYPFQLEVTVRYALDEDGLTVTTTARNLGESTCPFGCGHHPYLSPGSGTIDGCTLQVGASTAILTDPQRGLPTGTEAIRSGPLDFRTPRVLGEQVLDTPFTDLLRDGQGRAGAQLSAPDGSAVELWVDSSYTVLQVFTGDTLAPGRRRTGLAVEPMTCPPDALRSGQGLKVLAAGEETSASWGVRLLRG
jgi:aldose 1-epimerase